MSAARSGKTDVDTWACFSRQVVRHHQVVRLLLQAVEKSSSDVESSQANPFLLAPARYNDNDLGVALCEAARWVVASVGICVWSAPKLVRELV